MDTTRPEHEGWRYDVAIGRTRYTRADPQGLEALEVEDHVDMIGVARVTFTPDHPAWSDFVVGQDVEIGIGSGPKLFWGTVVGLQVVRRRGKERLIVRAMDPQVRLAASRRTRTFDDQKDSDIARAVLGDLAGRVDATDVTRAHVLQRNESDLDFVRRLAARSDRLVVAREGRIDFVRPAYGDRPVELGDDVVSDLDVTTSPLQIPPRLVVYGWDPAEAQKVEGTATGDDLQLVGDGRRATDAAGDLWREASTLSDVHLDAQGTAKQIAVAELNRLARTLVRGTATMTGRAEVRAGARVAIAGKRAGFHYDVFVISTRHVLEAGRGYTTELRFCSNTEPT